MPLTQVTAPATEPITVAEARRQLVLGVGAGEPAPSAPTVALLLPAAAGDCDNGIWRFGWVFVTPDGRTELGQLSAPVTVADKTVNGKIAISAPIGGVAVTSREGYAIPPGGSAALLFETINDNTTTSTVLNSAASSLGAQAPTVNTTLEPDLLGLIASVRGRGETACRRSFITQTWDEMRRSFPCDGVVELPRPPLQSVTWIHYVDTSGVTQTLAADQYVVTPYAGEKAPRGMIRLAYGCIWPNTRCQPDAVTIRFVSGYGAPASVPELLKTAMKLDLTNFYMHRGDDAAELPSVSASIYRSFKSRPRYTDETE